MAAWGTYYILTKHAFAMDFAKNNMHLKPYKNLRRCERRPCARALLAGGKRLAPTEPEVRPLSPIGDWGVVRLAYLAQGEGECFFILSERVQRYRTAVRVSQNKKYSPEPITIFFAKFQFTVIRNAIIHHDFSKVKKNIKKWQNPSTKISAILSIVCKKPVNSLFLRKWH